MHVDIDEANPLKRPAVKTIPLCHDNYGDTKKGFKKKVLDFLTIILLAPVAMHNEPPGQILIGPSFVRFIYFN